MIFKGALAGLVGVAGVVVVGNEDGAHHCITEIGGALNDIGYTIPGQAWTYWNKGPGPGDEEWLTPDEREVVDHHRPDGGTQPPRRSAGTAGAPAAAAAELTREVTNRRAIEAGYGS